MSVIDWVGLGLAALFLVAAVIRLLAEPLKLVLRLGLNATLGFSAM